MADSLNWGAGKKDQFLDWIHPELTTALTARKGLESQWLAWLTAYDAKRGPFREFPYPGASNEVLSIIATDVNQLYAKFMQTLHASPNLWSVSAMNERWVDVAKPMQDFLGILDSQRLKMFNVNKRTVLEMCKLGTAIYKTGWTFETRRVTTYNEMGKPVKAIKTDSYPFVDHVKLFDFVLPPSAYAIEPDAQGGAPWVAERMRVSPERLKMLAKSSAPDLPVIADMVLDIILRSEERTGTDYDSHVERAQYQRRLANEHGPLDENVVQVGVSSIAPSRTIELWEVHARFPASNDDTYDDIVCLVHLPTRQIVRATLNPYVHGQRPYSVIRYFPGEGFYGKGICEQKEMYQRVQSELFNFGIDGTLLSNTIMIGAKAGANVLPGEPIYPMKVWVTDGNPRDEITTMQFGQLNPALGSFLDLTERMGNRAPGVSDIQVGNMDNLPGRTPATTMMSMLQEGNRRPDLTIKDMRYEGLSRVGSQLVSMIQQYLTKVQDVGQGAMMKVMVDALGMPEGQLLVDQLTMPFDDATLGLGVTISATSGSSNKEVDKQNILSLLQLAGSVGPQVIQYTQMAMQYAGTPLGEVAVGAAQGTLELYRRALEQYDIRDPEKIVPASGTAGPQASFGAGAGPVGNPAGPPGASGMGLLPAGAGGAGGAPGQFAPVGPGVA